MVGAGHYRLWYQFGLPQDAAAGIQAAVPSSLVVDAEGRPPAVRLRFLSAAGGPAALPARR